MSINGYIFCCQSSKQTSQETAVHFNWVSHLSVVIGRFRSILVVSVFQGSLESLLLWLIAAKMLLLGFELLGCM